MINRIPIGRISHVKITAPFLYRSICSTNNNTDNRLCDAMISNIMIANPYFRNIIICIRIHIYSIRMITFCKFIVNYIFKTMIFHYILYSGYVRICSSFLYFIINKRRLIINSIRQNQRSRTKFFAVNIT